MSRDYKPRTKGQYAGQRKQKSASRQGVGVWRWMLITAIIIAFVVFLVYLRSVGPKPVAPQPNSPTTLGTKTPAATKEAQKPEVKQSPQFDFYNLLPKKEVEVPEYEIKTRTREERVGKAKDAHYIMQAGSFKTFTEAEQLRKKLASLGMASKIQKTKIGSTNWYRVNMGPFTQTNSVNANKARLRQNGIDVIVTETGGQATTH